MIIDTLEQLHRYAGLNPGFARALDFLMWPGLRTMPDGKYEIDGRNVYASISKALGRCPEDGLLEAHRKYIDIQLVLDGCDTMGWKPLSACALPSGAYDVGRDVQFFTDAPDMWVEVTPGKFAIFFPEDAHLPLVSSGQIRKVVIKVAV